MKKIFYTWQDVGTAANAIMTDLAADQWQPDYIVGVTRGGLALALILSNRMGVRMETLKVKLNAPFEGETSESNCWMSEDAFGYGGWNEEPVSRKNILVVDSINRDNSTFEWIKQDWQGSCLPGNNAWDSVWGSNVRFAVMTENLSSERSSTSYFWHTVTNEEWAVYPWEKDSWLRPSLG